MERGERIINQQGYSGAVGAVDKRIYPWAITPLLMLGGAFLCFEGVEKVLHTFEARKHKEDPAERQKRLEALAAQNPLAFEKIK